MNTRIFTLLVAFLAIAGNAVWGQTETYKITFEEETPEGLVEDEVYFESSGDTYFGDSFQLYDFFIITINETEKKPDDVRIALEENGGINIKAGDKVSLRLNNTPRYKLDVAPYQGYNLVSFDVKGKVSGQLVNVDNFSFTMPEENIIIENIRIERKVINILPVLYYSNNAPDMYKIDPIEGLDVYVENMDGEKITSTLYREKVRLVLRPKIGYKIEDIAQVRRTFGHFSYQIESGYKYDLTNPNPMGRVLYQQDDYYYEDFLIPQLDVQVVVFAADNYDDPDGPVTKVVPIDYNLTVSPTPSNGAITFGEDGTQTTANYQEQVRVNVTPSEGYHVVRSSLYYTIEGSDEKIPITMTNSVYSFVMPAANVTVHAEFAEGAGQMYLVSIADSEYGTISANPTEAKANEMINLTIASDEGYQLKELYYVANGSTEQVMISGTSFEMPTADVTVYATFEKTSGSNDNSGDDIHHPQRPIKYYNIYVDTICPGLDVETSKDVVAEGHQVSAYLTIQAECDTTGMRFEYKRGLFGYWQDLKELEGVQPGEYIIKNIYTDIYIRALDATLPEEEPTGIDDLEGIQAYAKEGSIYVYTPNREEVTIVSMSGAILKHEEQVGWQSYAVNRGIYIVRVGDKVFKLKN